ncbi:MAG: type 1 glutamine amidotransferase family protein [Bacteroidales bacterium]
MKKEILFIILDKFADWEGAYIAPSLNFGPEPGIESRYTVKTVSVTKDPVMSCGGFSVVPDYSIDAIPADYEGIVLIGGMSWFTPESSLIVPLIKDALERNKMVAGICNASVFLGMHGFLNNVKHTSNAPDYLKAFAGPTYTGEALYINEAATRDGKIVTANGLSALEFTREILYALETYSPEIIEKIYRVYKTGVWEAPEAQ